MLRCKVTQTAIEAAESQLRMRTINTDRLVPTLLLHKGVHYGTRAPHSLDT